MKSMGTIYHRQQAYLRTKAGRQMMKKKRITSSDATLQ